MPMPGVTITSSTSATTVGGLVKHLRWGRIRLVRYSFLQGRSRRQPSHARAGLESSRFSLDAMHCRPLTAGHNQAQCGGVPPEIAAQLPLEQSYRHGRLNTTVSLRWDLPAHDPGDG